MRRAPVARPLAALLLAALAACGAPGPAQAPATPPTALVTAPRQLADGRLYAFVELTGSAWQTMLAQP